MNYVWKCEINHLAVKIRCCQIQLLKALVVLIRTLNSPPHLLLIDPPPSPGANAFTHYMYKVQHVNIFATEEAIQNYPLLMSPVRECTITLCIREITLCIREITLCIREHSTYKNALFDLYIYMYNVTPRSYLNPLHLFFFQGTVLL